MAKSCCVCSDGKETTENRLFRCGGSGCGIIVHQACYGIVSVPSGVWFCRKCESQERAARVKCELCPKKDGALKRTDTGSWAHVVCALYIPEVTFGNLRTMEPIVTTKLPKERFSKACYICEELGQETQASTGACMSCHKSNCRLTFHVTCAQKEQLLVEEEDPRDMRNIIYCGYCSTHYKRMVKQKLKQQQSFRKGNPPIPASSHPPALPQSLPPPPPPPPFSSADNQGPTETGSNQSLDHNSTHQHSYLGHVHPTISKHPPSKSKDSSHIGGGGAERSFKRTSSDAGISSNKRKYRRRKLSSSNESSTSEAPSSTNEISLHNNNSNSVLSLVSTSSPSLLPSLPMETNVSKDIMERREGPREMLDCGNLDLLASVTQNFDQVVDCETSLPSHEKLESFSPPSSRPVETYGPPDLSIGEPILTVKEQNPSKRKGGGGGGGGGRKRKSTTNSGTSQKQSAVSSSTIASSSNLQPSSSAVANISSNSTAIQSGPPLSLQELLERQWEQTAQFILDQAGRQNNAGIMLAHLHELQSENRIMQARIMELASQREFFIATNARLRQTLAEGNIHKVLNGIQLLSSDNTLRASDNHRTFNHSGSSGGLSNDIEHHTVNPLHQSPNPGPLFDSGRHNGSLVAATSTHSSHNSSGGPGRSSFSDRQAHHVTSNSLTLYPFSSSSDASHVLMTPPTAGHHGNEITRVTNSVQGPIAAYTGLPVSVTSPSSYHRHST
ncbi:PREDICTED: protein AF-10-like [Amphimedon queenslandica]|uniref:PHD-type domain-containing protein n=1 Tax=Amphimedon queenslandica TaxID=400682 RepID=A0A1X7VV23_AMPQE|nr:PREDICTED: protein AF-10-like [Amphimedon queenslandica]|eukprot:XP_019851070.1 PREDICTED: protein AF-10-like [Amphimedon queenslandica]